MTFEKIKTEIQSIGNTVVAGSYIFFEDELENRLIIKGNWLQLVGTILNAIGQTQEELAENEKDQDKKLAN